MRHTGAPCVLAARSPSTPRQRSVIPIRVPRRLRPRVGAGVRSIRLGLRADLDRAGLDELHLGDVDLEDARSERRAYLPQIGLRRQREPSLEVLLEALVEVEGPVL